MVKNTLSSAQYHGVHVKLVRKRHRTCYKGKIISMDNDRNQSRMYDANMTYTPAWTICTPKIINSTITSTKNCFSSTNLSSQRDKKTSNYAQLQSTSVITRSEICISTKNNTEPIDSKNNSQHRVYVDQSQRRNLTCKTILVILAICLLGLLVIAALILPNVVLYLMMPIIFPPPVNPTNLSEPIYAKHCGGVSSWTGWLYYSSSAIYMHIDTSNCSFNITPLYYTSIDGSDLHSDLTGSDAIYGASKYGFKIYVRSYSGWSETQMFNYSQTEQWNVEWVGIYY